ncbi:hypothetical protein ASG33_06060 [Dyadobacter sp. Leaf189]|nr:hypothetical protein ASG33_06060 [Dyadobacter sp. Leaf189]
MALLFYKQGAPLGLRTGGFSTLILFNYLDNATPKPLLFNYWIMLHPKHHPAITSIMLHPSR